MKCPRPGGAFYAFPDVSAHYGRSMGGQRLDGSASFAKALLDHAAVAVTPGSAFGVDCCVRISFATSLERLHEGMARIRKALEELT